MKQPVPWSAVCDADELVRIYPDGCRDIIWSHVPGSAPTWHYSVLDDRSRTVNVVQGQAFCSVRLPPGAELTPGLLSTLRTDARERAIEDALQGWRIDPLVSEVLEALSHGEPARVSLDRKVMSLRSVQRLLATKTGRGPLFWSRLARARRAARSVHEGCPLAQCAAEWGYADQAHMTREFRHWFEITPAALWTNADAARALLSAGYAV
jgi:AraC-like DNA-binding protein